MGWGTITNNISYGTIYNESWTGEYKFVTIVGDGNDMYKRITDDSGSMEANACLQCLFSKHI
jgi:hypothetical protein